MELASKYDPQDVEGKWYQYWLDNKLFSSKPDGRDPYTVVIPPPNVTGVLLLLSEYQWCDDGYQFGLRLPFSRNNGIHLVGRHGYGCVCQPFQSAYLSLFVTVGNLLQLDVQHAGSQHEDQSLWYCLLGTFRSYGRCLLSVGS